MKTLGIINAVKWESQPFIEAYNLREEMRGDRMYYVGKTHDLFIVVTNCHAGPVNAAAAAEALISLFSPSWIINTGSAGSHSVDIAPGSVVVGNAYTINYNVLEEENGIIRSKKSSMIRFFDSNNQEVTMPSLPADAALLQALERLSNEQDLDLQFVRIGSEDAWTVDPATIAAKTRRFGHKVEDKESAYIAQICHQHSVPFVAVRGISDNELLGGIYTLAEMNDLMAKASKTAAEVVQHLVKSLATTS